MIDQQSTQSELSRLWERIGNLEARINENKKGFFGWINKWGVLVGLVATFLSIIGGAIGVSSSIRSLNPKPNTKVFPYEDATISQKFDLENDRVTYSINCIITNNGDADDLILVQSTFKVPDLPKEDISHSFGGDFEITDQTGRKLPRPFVLPKGTNLELSCSMSFKYSDKSANAFEKDGMRRLRVVFDNGTANPPSLSFCFDGVFTPDSHEFFNQECPDNF